MFFVVPVILALTLQATLTAESLEYQKKFNSTLAKLSD